MSGDLFLAGDVHLDPEPAPHPGREAFLRFLRLLSGREPGTLCITGDLFDYWFEYRRFSPAGHERVLDALRRLSEAGWRLDFLPGNHDWWVGAHFSRATGAAVLREVPVEYRPGGLRVLAAHGDGLGGGDFGYRRILRPVLRSGISIAMFSLLHPDLAAAFARATSGTSRTVLRRRLDRLPRGLVSWADGMLSAGASAVVTGHAHIAACRGSGNGSHISLGDWITDPSWARFPAGDPGHPALERPGSD